MFEELNNNRTLFQSFIRVQKKKKIESLMIHCNL